MTSLKCHGMIMCGVMHWATWTTNDKYWELQRRLSHQSHHNTVTLRVFTYAIYNNSKASPSHYGRVNFRFSTKWFKNIMWFPFMWTECNKYFFILLCFLSFVQIPIFELSLIHMRITNIVHVSRSFSFYFRISPFYPLQGNYFHFDFSAHTFRVLWHFTRPQQLNVHVALVTLTRPSKGQKRQATWTWKLAMWDFLNSDKWLGWAAKI